jgi:hypothetical protein
MKFSIDAQIEEVEREIRLRREVYPRQVANGRMRQSVAEYHLNRMIAVLDTLKVLLQVEREQKRDLVKDVNMGPPDEPA